MSFVEAKSEKGTQEEQEALKGDGVDVETMLQQAVRVRLPRLNKEGEFKPAAKAGKESVKKTARKSAAAASSATIKAVRESLGDSLNVRFPPTQEDLTSLVKKYFPDLVVQCLYVGGTLALINQSSAVDAVVAKHGSAADLGGNVLQLDAVDASAAAADVEAVTENASETVLHLWVVCMGVVSGLVLVLKNVGSLASWLFEAIDKMEDSVNEAIDILQGELQDDIKEMLEDNMQSGAASRMATWSIVGSVSSAIDEAQKDLDINTLLPCPVATKCNFMATFGSPGVIFVLSMGVIQYLNGATTGSENATRQLLASPAQDVLTQTGPMIQNVLTNVLWSFISSWPVTRFLTNTAIGVVQQTTNSYLYSTVAENIPGGVKGVQSTVDAVSDGGGIMRTLSSISYSRQSCRPQNLKCNVM